MSIAKQEFTNAGRSMLGRAQAGETLTISKLVVGSGGATTPSELWPLTALITHEMDVVISSKRDLGNGTLMIEGSFRSDTAPHSFSLKEVGVMAHVAAEADRLYSVANCLAEPPDLIDPAAPTMQVFKLKLVIDRIPEDDLIIQIGPSENVVGENIGADTVGAGVYKEAAGNVLYYKRLVEGSGVEILDEPDTITIGVRTLKYDLDLYVPATHPDAPNPDVAFPSVQAAHDYLLQFVIPASKAARIHVDKVTLHHNGTTFTHPNSKQISLLGAARIDKTVTQIISSGGGTSKNVALLGGDTTGLAAGQIVFLAWPIFSHWAGGCRINSVGAGFVVCSVLNRSARPALTTSDLVGNRRLSRFPSVLVNDTPTSNNLYFPNGIGLVQNITVENGYGGFAINEAGTIDKCMAINCTRGFLIAASLIKFSSEVIASDCDFGFSGQGAVYAPDVLYANGCGRGVAIEGASGYSIGALIASQTGSHVMLNHCQTGMHAYAGANLRCGQLNFDTNDFGIVSENGSAIVVIGLFQNYPANNGTDLYANGMSFISYAKGGGAVPSCNPAAGVVGNANSYISVLP